MRTSAVSGIVFANSNDNLLKQLTESRSMASVPFGGRYRLIDFCLSNLVNAGIINIALITNTNYRSLMDHVGSGIYWDLDRKTGGLHILAPYMTSGIRRFNGTVDGLIAASDYIARCESDYMVLCSADTLVNVDISAVMESHIEREADITVVYHKGMLSGNCDDVMFLSLDEQDRIDSVNFTAVSGTETAYGIGITVISRKLLTELVKEAAGSDYKSFNRQILARKTKHLNIVGYEHKGFVTLMNGIDTYYRASMDLLKPEVRRDLFNQNHPIYTKTKDEMPTRYGIEAQVKNCVLGEGCVIDGTVKNSILFRGVKVEKGAVVENSILMQETKVCAGAQLNNVIADKNAVIRENTVLKSATHNQFFVSKNQMI